MIKQLEPFPDLTEWALRRTRYRITLGNFSLGLRSPIPFWLLPRSMRAAIFVEYFDSWDISIAVGAVWINGEREFNKNNIEVARHAAKRFAYFITSRYGEVLATNDNYPDRISASIAAIAEARRIINK